MVPIGDAHGIVLCDGCKSRFDPSVLEMSNRDPVVVDRDQFENEALRAAILIAMIDGEINDTDVPNLLTVASHLAGMPIDREVLGLHTSIARENKVPIENYIRPIAHRWNDEQKREGLGAMFLSASATGTMRPEQSRILSELHDILNLSESQFQAAVEEALTWEQVPNEATNDE